MNTSLLEFRRRTLNTPPPTLHAVDDLLAPLERAAETSPHFISRSRGHFESAGDDYSLPRYVFLGPKGGGETIRIGIFATIHGDEPEGAHGMARFVATLEGNPEIAEGYALFLYPVCNPGALEAGTRHSRSGKDLNREFWRQSSEPEVRYLEAEIARNAFDGIITLHSDDTSDGLYGFVSGAVLTENLLEPALRAAEQFLPRNRGRVIDGFAAQHGIITDCYDGVLRAQPGLERSPFEITFETPQKAPPDRQVGAFNAALQTILVEYRGFMAMAQNI